MTVIKNDVINEYTNSGSDRYSITFEYDRPEQVTVRTYNSDTNEYENVTDWVFDGATAIRFTGVVPDTFEIVRVTDISQSYGESRYAVFQQGSAIKAGDLNGNLELLRLAIEEGANDNDSQQDQINDLNDEIDRLDGRIDQEIIDRENGDQNLQDQIDDIETNIDQIEGGSLDGRYVLKAGDTMTGPLSMSRNKITNVGDPSEDLDAVNLRTLTDFIDSSPDDPDGNKPSYTRYSITATGGETDITVPIFIRGGELVFINGAQLTRDVDYDTPDTISVVLAQPLLAGDVFDLYCVNTLKIVEVPLGDTGNLPVVRENWVASQGDTTFTLEGGVRYTPGKEQIYLNGSLLKRDIDYTGNVPTTFVLTQGANEGDEVELYCQNFAISIEGDVNDLDLSAGNMTYQYPGGVQRTVQNRLEDRVSVKDFGAVGDGSTDDTAAIQAAINTCNHVSFPVGTYLISDSIDLHSNLIIDGEGTVKHTAPNKSFKTETDGVYNNITIRDITIDGDGQLMARGIAISGGQTIRIENVTILNCGQFPASGNILDDASSGGYGITVSSKFFLSTDVVISGCTIARIGGGGYYSGDGIYVEGYDPNEVNLPVDMQVVIENCFVSTVGRHCYTIAGEGASIPRGVRITNCYGEKSALCGIDIEDGKSITIDGCTFKECGNDQTYYNPQAEYGSSAGRLITGIATGNQLNENIVIRNTIFDTCYQGLTTGATAGLVVDCCEFRGNLTVDIANPLAGGPSNYYISNCSFEEEVSVYATNNSHRTFTNCRFAKLFTIRDGSGWSFDNCQFDSYVLVNNNTSEYLKFVNCTFNGEYGIASPSNQTPQKVTVDNCTFIGQTESSLLNGYGAIKNWTITNNTFDSCAVAIGADRSDTGGPTYDNLQIDGNLFIDCTLGIKMRKVNLYGSISNNQFTGTTTTCIELNGSSMDGGFMLSNNSANGTFTNGINFGGNFDRAVITGNNFSLATGTAINVGANANGITDNNI